MPRWDGLWVTAGNTSMDAFVDAPGFSGEVREGVLTPEYEVAFRERWREQVELGQVQYDRLTHCEPQGYPRILLEPYTHEFVNLPGMSYFINDFDSAVRRIHIGAEHINLLGTHTWFGDTVGFWDGNKLVTHTVDLLPADFTRWAPMTSNQFESGEVWACGRDAAALLAALVSGKQVRCTQRDRDDYGRVVATCLAGRIDLAAEMVNSGYAIALPQFTQAYVELEARAQSLGIGLWGSEFREPAAWRAANRDPQAEQRIAAQRAQTVEQQNISVPVFFRNCDEARAYGYSSMRRGQPGYRPQLDGDNDGIACEPYRGPR